MSYSLNSYRGLYRLKGLGSKLVKGGLCRKYYRVRELVMCRELVSPWIGTLEGREFRVESFGFGV